MGSIDAADGIGAAVTTSGGAANANDTIGLLIPVISLPEFATNRAVLLSADTGLLFLALIGCFTVGWFVFYPFVFANYESVKRRSVQFLFCSSFALSCSLFMLVVLEIINALVRVPPIPRLLLSAAKALILCCCLLRCCCVRVPDRGGCISNWI